MKIGDRANTFMGKGTVTNFDFKNDEMGYYGRPCIKLDTPPENKWSKELHDKQNGLYFFYDEFTRIPKQKED